MEGLGRRNGAFDPIVEMAIPTNDRVCWFGDGVFDAGPAQLSVFALDDHLDRLYGSARLAGIEIPMPLDGLILPDIARKHLIAAVKRLGIGVHEEPFDLDTPHGAQGTIVTNSSNLCLFAEEFESKSFGGGSPEVAEALRAEVNREFTEATAI